MKNIYQLEKINYGDGKIYCYEEENKAIGELEMEYELCLKEFRDKDKDRYETSLSYKNYMIKTNNLKEAIKLSKLDEEDAMYDLKLNDLDKDITFQECEYILRNIEDEHIDNLFEVVEEKYPFYIGTSGKDIDKHFAYNYFKEKIKLELDYEFINKDNLFEIFEDSKNAIEFAENVFSNIKVLGVEPEKIGLSWEDFNIKILDLYKETIKQYNYEKIILNREFYAIKSFIAKGHNYKINNKIVFDKEEAEEIADKLFSNYNWKDYSYNRHNDLLVIEKYRIKDESIKDIKTLLEKFEDEQGSLEFCLEEFKKEQAYVTFLCLQGFKEERVYTSPFVLEKVEKCYIFDGLQFNSDVEIKERENSRNTNEIKVYDEQILEKKIENKKFTEAITKCEINKDPIGYGIYVVRGNEYYPKNKLFIENLENNGYKELVEDIKFWEYCFYRDIEMIDLIPDKFKDVEMCKKAVNYWGCFIRAVPDEILKENKNLLYDALKERAIAITHIPEKYKDEELYKKALEIDEEIIEYIPKEYIPNQKFEEPKVSVEKNEELYKKLLLETNIKKRNLIKMFKNKEIYADEKGNAIIPIKNNDEIVGGYKIDFSKTENPILLKNSDITKQDEVERASNLTNKIFENLEIQKVQEVTLEC